MRITFAEMKEEYREILKSGGIHAFDLRFDQVTSDITAKFRIVAAVYDRLFQARLRREPSFDFAGTARTIIDRPYIIHFS